MTGLTDTTDGVFITEYVQHTANPDATIITSKALDGSYYQQIIGSPGVQITATVYVDPAGKQRLETAQAHGNMMRFESFGIVNFGRITTLAFEHVGRKHYRAEISANGEDAE